MIEKTIRNVLRKKFEEWVDSITDSKLRETVEKNTMITGGAIASLLMNEKPNDYDLYFKDITTALAVTTYYADMFNASKRIKGVIEPRAQIRVVDANDKEFENTDINEFPEGSRIKIWIQSQGVSEETEGTGPFQNLIEADDIEDSFLEDGDDIEDSSLANDDKETEKQKYRPVYLTSNAITLSDKIQIIIRFYGTPKEIHENFDFLHCTNYYIPDTNYLHLEKDALVSIMNKNLVYTGSKYPVCSILRVRKFIKKGWHINAGHLLKIMFQISELNLSRVDVLEDQLVGVDSSYFSSLIRALRKKQEADPYFVILKDYVATLVDKIFG